MLSSITYRDSNNTRKPSNAAAAANRKTLNQSNIILLIHGYNNTEIEAIQSYHRFMEFQDDIGPFSAELTGVHWPGDNWTGPANYMNALDNMVMPVADYLSADLHYAAQARGFVKVDIVAHSLGCRLALETADKLLALQQQNNAPGLKINRIVFMAGAVPRHQLDMEDGNRERLRNAIEYFDKSMSLYSKADLVLHWGFPVGESLVGEGVFPLALGRRKWVAGANNLPQLDQEENLHAGHSDYWGGMSENTGSLAQAAGYVRKFIDLGAVPVRKTDERTNMPGRDISERAVSAGRVM